MENLKKYINDNPPVSTMMHRYEIYGVMYHLDKVLKSNIDGDIVELGCNVGTTSVYIREMLNKYKSSKKYHVYDSWEGLPKKMEYDIGLGDRQFLEGQCKTSKESFIQTFKTKNLVPPEIHSGWFKEIPDNEYPDKICFAFLDGDFYSSIMDSLNKIYHKVVKDGIIIIDDCGWSALPGCKKAAEDFLQDKKETLKLTAYPDKYDYNKWKGGGKIVKI